jgi:serine/threonine protein kinase
MKLIIIIIMLFFRRISPSDLTKEQILKFLLTRVDTMKTLMRACTTFNLLLSNEISFSSLELFERIGVGATASVYRGVWNKEAVAVKIFREGTDEQEFRKEMAIPSLLQHKNLVKVHGIGVKEGGIPFIVFEMVERGSLYRFLHPDEKEPQVEY